MVYCVCLFFVLRVHAHACVTVSRVNHCVCVCVVCVVCVVCMVCCIVMLQRIAIGHSI